VCQVGRSSKVGQRGSIVPFLEGGFDRQMEFLCEKRELLFTVETLS
jgi:hypothetical protein